MSCKIGVKLISYSLVTFIATCLINKAHAYNYDLSQSTNYNIRFYSSKGCTAYLNSFDYSTGDINNNGIPDVIVSITNDDNNSRDDSGSVYVIYDDLLQSLSGTGNAVDLTSASNFNLRFDGALAGDTLGSGGITIADLNNNGKSDILLGSYHIDPYGRSNAGAEYVIYDALFENLDGTGHIFDMSEDSNWNLRFDGGQTHDHIGGGIIVTDINGNGANDIAFSGGTADYGYTDNGSVWIIYDQIFSGLSGTGNHIDLLANGANSNWNLRFDGAAKNDSLSIKAIADIGGSALDDFVMGAIGSVAAANGKVYIIYDTIFKDIGNKGNILSLSSTSNYSYKFTGPVSSRTGGSIKLANLDMDNDLDLLIGATDADYSGANSGSVWVIYHNLLQTFATQDIDLTSNANWNLRFDGEAATYRCGKAFVADIDTNNVTDTLIGCMGVGDSMEGRVYAIKNSILAGAPNQSVLNLGNTDNYNFYFQGSTIAMITDIDFSDANIDEKPDFIIPKINTGDCQGSLWLIYNFPHELTYTTANPNTNDTTPGIEGDITAPNSATTVGMVQYSIDDDTFEGGPDGWQNCSAEDGTFDSTNESYICTPTTPLADGDYTMYVRAYDANASYTAETAYESFTFKVDTVAPTGTLSVNAGDTWTNDGNIHLALTATDNATPISQMMLSEDSGFNGGVWEAYSTNKTIPLSSGDAEKTIYVKYRDSAGNESMTYTYTIGLDTQVPNDFKLVSPDDYCSGCTRPTLKFHKAEDTLSGIANYTVYLDKTKDQNYSYESIPANGSGTVKDNDNVVIKFKADDIIEIYFKDLDDHKLTEGAHTWTVTATDNAGNTYTEEQTFYLDRTEPQIEGLTIAGVSEVETKEGIPHVYKLPAVNEYLSLFGKAFDQYVGSKNDNDTYDKAASGPKQLTLEILKLKNDNGFNAGTTPPTADDQYESFSKSNQELQYEDKKDNEKRTNFYITSSKKLTSGVYKIKVTLEDNANNTYKYPALYVYNPTSKLSSWVAGISDSIFPTEQTTQILGEQNVLGSVEGIGTTDNTDNTGKYTVPVKQHNEFIKIIWYVLLGFGVVCVFLWSLGKLRKKKSIDTHKHIYGTLRKL